MPSHPTPRAEAEAVEILNQDATVTAVEPMDWDRSDDLDAAVDALREQVEDHVDVGGLGPVTEDTPAWREAVEELTTELPPDGPSGLVDELDAYVTRAEMPYPSLVRLQFDPADRLDFVPGQYVRISYDEEEPRVYSIASSPNADDVELAVRRVPGGELTPDLCDQAEVGDRLFVRGPYGDEFTLQAPSDRDLVFVATGTGVAPFKSMLDYLFEEGLDAFEGSPRQVWLFLGSKWEDSLPYAEAFREMDDAHENFHFVPTLSRENYLSDWDGETAYVQQTMLKFLPTDATDRLPDELAEFAETDPAVDIDRRIDPAAMETYVCGLGVMAQGVVDVLEALGLPEQLVRVESYG